jgi:hypothetical protein
MNSPTIRPLRLGFSLWLLGMPGVVAVTIEVLPRLLAGHASVLPLHAIEAISLAQSALLLAFAVWVGARCHGRAGLRAPLVEALWRGEGAGAVAARQALPALVGGALGALLLVAIGMFGPLVMRTLAHATPFPLSARLLYGGFTEELLLRWGAMTALLWAWRRFVPGTLAASSAGVLLAIALSAFLFGIGHLAAAASLLGPLSLQVVATVVLGNAAFGIVAGFVYWRFGLECAFGTHLLTHAFAAAAGY